MTRCLFFFLWICTSVCVWSQRTYEIHSAGQGKNGHYLVKVSINTSDPKHSYDELKQCAVHGVLFHGVMGDVNGNNSQNALIQKTDAENTYSELFQSFFNSGEYNKYVNLNTSSISSYKTKGHKYKVSALLIVDKEELIKWLQQTGVISGFDDLW